ncbi:unnamed protein product [Vitrella brassicaformis CCMP3155]|uniref:Uncharacterized protein n=1 Tax=Vitrella brassicaformis (strain CCMP3155) TaxID=1169540 RepID=A0A0G4FLT6_VITBC|nr:unnamed protein product [Vitrella brassicaformis CCMP3155]|eukprot:CEM14982.1 unnamed protein product [Vitrella brassicaformis CCMP3155]
MGERTHNLLMDKWGLSDKEIEDLCYMLPEAPELGSMSLCSNGFGSRAVIALSEVLPVKAPHLHTLILSYNDIHKNGCVALRDMLMGRFELRSLSLDHNQIGDEGLAYLSEAFTHTPHLHSLDLRSNGLTDSSSHLLAARLPYCVSLTKCRLDDNMLSPAGVQRLVEAKKRCVSLTTLSIDRQRERSISRAHETARLARGYLKKLYMNVVPVLLAC